MSLFARITARCPSCQTRMDVDAPLSVNVERSPAIRDAVLANEFQRFACEGCGSAVQIIQDFYYIDPTRAVFVHVVSPHDPLTTAKLKACKDEWRRWSTCWHSATHEKTRFRCRIVVGLEKLREKLIIWDAGFDDRALEACKFRHAQAKNWDCGRYDLTLLWASPKGRCLFDVSAGTWIGRTLEELAPRDDETKLTGDWLVDICGQQQLGRKLVFQ